MVHTPEYLGAHLKSNPLRCAVDIHLQHSWFISGIISKRRDREMTQKK